MFKVKNNLFPMIMEDIFKFTKPYYNTSKANPLSRHNVKTVNHGTETISFLGPKIWDLIPDNLKNLDPLEENLGSLSSAPAEFVKHALYLLVIFDHTCYIFSKF